LRTAFHPAILGLIYPKEFLSAIPQPFAAVLMRRLARGISASPNRMNPHAWQLFLGENPPGWVPLAPKAEMLTLACADAAAYLETGPQGSFDAFSLSNILDATPPAYERRLLAAVRHAARPGAVAILRSFSEPVSEEAERWAAADRSWLWGSVRILRPTV
jgi:S-adenosylmethionine:diacylglycerol 3-amino-3-carboxypropyl transferase